ncbi:sugar transferase [Pusillimonas sp. 7-48]|uniref:Sugar transferase n=1 Tax=Pusillimonas minor TaxID=2697024 RepID=A0A842HS76_9BURK|nr:sugar transferase [Pusillimonas minor]MBC2771026.1 sugar transferase [Pusillimonas minor]
MPPNNPQARLNTTRLFNVKSGGLLRRISIQYVQALTDFIAFCLAPLVAAGLLYSWQGSTQPYFPQKSLALSVTLHVGLGLVCIGWFWVRLRHYTYRKTFWAELGEILRTIAVLALVQLVVMALLKVQPSRYAWALTWLWAFMLVPATRFSVKRLLAALGLWQKPSVIIGVGPNAQEAYAALSHESAMGFKFQYFFTGEPAGAPPSLHGVPVISDEATLWANTSPVNTHFFIAVENGQEALRDYWIKQTTLHGCYAVSVIPTTRGLPLNSLDAGFIFSHDVLILRINESLRKRASRITKRAFDIFGSAVLLAVLAPAFAYIGWRISRDGGSPIFGHERIGQNGKPFKCLKFRSMVLNSQEVLADLLANNPAARAEWNADFKLKNDPRITPIGHFLRRSSLDELPQLFSDN